MTVDELYSIFLRHTHSGSAPDARRIDVMSKTTIVSDGVSSFVILTSPNGTKFIIGVDDDGTLKTIKI